MQWGSRPLRLMKRSPSFPRRKPLRGAFPYIFPRTLSRYSWVTRSDLSSFDRWSPISLLAALPIKTHPLTLPGLVVDLAHITL